MSSKHIGIEEARKTLGPLVDEARAGTEIVLTRHGKPIARIAPHEEAPLPSVAEKLATFRLMATRSPVSDRGAERLDRAGWDLAVAKVGYEIAPFAKLISDIDAFFGDELDEALSGDEAAQAEAEARRIISEHLASATMRLALSAAAGSQVQWLSADVDTLQQLATVAVQRAADMRFVEIVSSAVKVSV
jgi:prevent-host-death family protein